MTSMTREPARILVHVQPGAKHNEILGFRNGTLWVRIAVPPVEGKANRELVECLSDVLKVGRSNVAIERGATGRNKRVAIIGVEIDRVVKLLDEASSR